MNSNSLSRRRFLQAGAAAPLFPAGFSRAQVPPTDPGITYEVSVADIQAGYERSDFSIAEFTEASMKRIEDLDGADTWLAAMIETNPDALDIAEQLDSERKAGTIRGPMHGIPVVVKDVFATADRMQTTAGSRSMEGTRASRDAFIVERMREAGMVILGKSNMTEWSGFRPTLYGWSPRGGLSVNPYVTSQTTWGSSSGSAAAVAASYVPVSVGVETDGSILCPASACGVVGIKPTVGVTSRQGGIGNGYSLDSPGVMGRTVADAAQLLSVIAGFDPQDVAYGEHAELFPAGRDYRTRVHIPGQRDYARAIAEGGLQGARIGVVRGYWGVDAEADRHAENALEALKDAGAVLVDDIYPEGQSALEGTLVASETMGVEFPALFQRFLDDYAPDNDVRSLADVIGWYEAHPEESHWAWENDAFSQTLWSLEEWDEQHISWISEMHSAARANGIDAVIEDYEVDALIAPTSALPTRWDNTSYFWASTQLSASAGYPSVTIPIGYTEGVPAGLHFFGPAFTERRLIRFAAELERTMQARTAPRFLEATNYDDIYAPVPVPEEEDDAE